MVKLWEKVDFLKRPVHRGIVLLKEEELAHDSLGHPSAQPKRHLDRCSCFCTDDRSPQRAPMLYNGTPICPLKIAPSHGESGPLSNTWFLSPPESSTQTVSRSVRPFCRAHLCDRPTDRARPTRSLTIGRIYVLLWGLIIVYPRHWIDPLISFFRLSVSQSVSLCVC